MDIDAISSASAAATQSSQSIAVLKMTMNAEKAAGKAALQLIQTATPQGQEPGKGGAVDVTV